MIPVGPRARRSLLLRLSRLPLAPNAKMIQRATDVRLRTMLMRNRTGSSNRRTVRCRPLLTKRGWVQPRRRLKTQRLGDSGPAPILHHREERGIRALPDVRPEIDLWSVEDVLVVAD